MTPEQRIAALRKALRVSNKARRNHFQDLKFVGSKLVNATRDIDEYKTSRDAWQYKVLKLNDSVENRTILIMVLLAAISIVQTVNWGIRPTVYDNGRKDEVCRVHCAPLAYVRSDDKCGCVTPEKP